MQPKFTLVLFFILFFSIIHSQTKNTSSISGIVIDESNALPLPGAVLKISGQNKSVFTDADGKYKIENIVQGEYSLTISYVGYETKQVDNVAIKNGEAATLTVSLNAQKRTLKDVVVKSDAKRENLNGVLALRKNSTVVSDIISAEQIKRSPDKNTSDVLKRISGTTIQENKFVVVRGMNDRYNEAMLNGALLPSSEPDRKTFAFDIFPAEIVDNITVIKTASPDLPGSFAGGLVQVNTKDVPDKKFIDVKAGLGYNTITTNKTYREAPGGSTDWLGYDDGFRRLPGDFPKAVRYYKMHDAKKEMFSRQIKNLWAFNVIEAPLNTTFQLSGGFSKTADGKNYPRFGAIFGVVYTSTYTFNNIHRYDYRNVGNTDTVYKYNDSAFTRTILASALGNFSFKINQNNKFFLNNILSINSANQATFRSGYSFDNQWNLKANAAYFVSNRIYNGQFGGDHFIIKSKTRIKWLAYYTDLFRNEPDYRRNQFVDIGSGNYFALITATPNSNYGSHYYATVSDKTKGANLDIAQPFKLFGNSQNFKTGAAFYHNDRNRQARTISVETTNGFSSGSQGYLYWAQDSIYNKNNFYSNGGFLYQELPDSKNNYNGTINNEAAYAMLDNKFTQKLRLVWGVRFENYHQTLNSFNDDQTPLRIDTTYHNVLPSANFIYSILPKANIRLSYSKTVAHPQYRELAPAYFYDFLTNTNFYGDPHLTETRIRNFDIRWEHYFVNAQYYSVSGFYKKFQDPIELYIPFAGSDSKTVSTRNDTTATSIGIEIEGRKNFGFVNKFLEPLVAFANVAFIKSHIAKVDTDTIERPLQGQSPYIINLGLQYTEPKTNIAFSALYNSIGDRLFLVGAAVGQGSDPIWEKTHPAFDFKLSKTFLKNGLVEISAADILHKKDILYYDENGNRKYDSDIDRIVSAKTNGVRLGVSVEYRF